MVNVSMFAPETTQSSGLRLEQPTPQKKGCCVMKS